MTTANHPENQKPNGPHDLGQISTSNSKPGTRGLVRAYLCRNQTMNRYTPRNSPEFEARQLCLEFGGRARRIMQAVAKTISKCHNLIVRHFRTPITGKVHQLVLELDSIAQMPLWRTNDA